jgi:hypothetical protein
MLLESNASRLTVSSCMDKNNQLQEQIIPTVPEGMDVWTAVILDDCSSKSHCFVAISQWHTRLGGSVYKDFLGLTPKTWFHTTFLLSVYSVFCSSLCSTLIPYYDCFNIHKTYCHQLAICITPRKCSMIFTATFWYNFGTMHHILGVNSPQGKHNWLISCVTHQKRVQHSHLYWYSLG